MDYYASGVCTRFWVKENTSHVCAPPFLLFVVVVVAVAAAELAMFVLILERISISIVTINWGASLIECAYYVSLTLDWAGLYRYLWLN